MNGRWRDILTEEESAKYERMAAEQLDRDCVRWINAGEISRTSAADRTRLGEVL